jgi:hypothetical protein
MCVTSRYAVRLDPARLLLPLRHYGGCVCSVRIVVEACSSKGRRTGEGRCAYRSTSVGRLMLDQKQVDTMTTQESSRTHVFVRYRCATNGCVVDGTMDRELSLVR